MDVTNIGNYRKRKNLERTIGKFRDCLIETTNIEDYVRVDKELGSLKEELERTCVKDLPEEELESIYSPYRGNALCALGNSLSAFFYLRGSETSRMLDLSAWFAKFLKVPDLEYIDTVLENTPELYRTNELNNQLENKKITNNDLYGLLDKYGLELYVKL